MLFIFFPEKGISLFFWAKIFLGFELSYAAEGKCLL